MRPILPPPTSDRAGPRGAFTLIEAVVALVVTAFVATAVARITIAALERERKAGVDAAAARAVKALAVSLAEAGPDAATSRKLPDGWRAAQREEANGSGAWQSWELFAPGSVQPDHVVHLPPPLPRQAARTGGGSPTADAPP